MSRPLSSHITSQRNKLVIYTCSKLVSQQVSKNVSPIVLFDAKKKPCLKIHFPTTRHSLSPCVGNQTTPSLKFPSQRCSNHLCKLQSCNKQKIIISFIFFYLMDKNLCEVVTGKPTLFKAIVTQRRRKPRARVSCSKFISNSNLTKSAYHLLLQEVEHVPCLSFLGQ